MRRTRIAGLGGVALLTYAYVSVLYHVADVVGEAGTMLALLAATVALATLVGRYVRLPVALGATVVLLGGGAAVYFLSVPEGIRASLTITRLLQDTLALLTGLSVLRLTAAGVWALSVAPAPVFLSWYLAVRERYAWSVAVGGLGLGMVVLTGDADAVTTLVGVVGAAVALGVGGTTVLDRSADATRDDEAVDHARRAQLETLAAVVSGMVVVAGTRSVVPGSAASPLLPGGSSGTVESSLVDAEDEVSVLGSIRLSPAVRFVVESDEAQNWQTAAYDRYTGRGWVRTGDTRPYDGRIAGPEGAARTLRQRVTARTALGTIPAAWKPVAVDGTAARVAVETPQGGIRPSTSLSEGSEFSVTSRVPQYTTEQLRRAGTDYPDDVALAYRQVPESTPDVVRDRAEEVTAEAESPYEAAVAIRDYLEAEKSYSLSVTRPSGDIAAAFLTRMDAGYCVYYATAMAVMLRAIDVPARFVVGYTPGEETDDGFVVRGLDSHAWVQVYFPDVGWVDFDPTPAGPRREAEAARLQEARENGELETESGEEPSPSDDPTTETPTSTPTTPDGATRTTAGPPVTAPQAGGDGGTALPSLPDRETLALWGVAAVGVVAGARRTGLTTRLYRSVWLRRQGTSRDPDRDAERAFARLERLLTGTKRARRPGETPRAYVRAVADDERMLTVLDAYEDARYGAGVDRDRANEAVRAVGELVRERTLPWRLWS